jgi:L-rhamnose isomerase
MVDNLDTAVAALQAAGKQRVYWGVAKGGVRFAYLVEDEHPGAMIELIERGPAIEALMTIVKQASVNWDGSNPVRQLG